MDGAGLVDLLTHLVGERGSDEVAHFFAERNRCGRGHEVHQRVPTSGPYRRAASRWYSCVGVSITKRPTLGAAVIELDVVLLHVAVAAVEVKPAFRGALRVLGREQERHRTEVGGVVATGVERPGRFAGEQLRAVERDRDVGQRVLDRLERADRLAELVALGDVLAGDARGRPDRRRRARHS